MIGADLSTLFYRFGVILFIGISVGLQREYASEVHGISESRSEMFAGVRTFALMSLVGCTAALLADLLGVVLISGISFLGYVLMKMTSVKQGIPLTGLLGGLASSTATTLSFAQRSRKNKLLGRSFALANVQAESTSLHISFFVK